MNEQSVTIRTFRGDRIAATKTKASHAQLLLIARDLAEKGHESEMLRNVLPLRHRRYMDLLAGFEVEFHGGLKNRITRFQVPSVR